MLILAIMFLHYQLAYIVHHASLAKSTHLALQHRDPLIEPIKDITVILCLCPMRFRQCIESPLNLPQFPLLLLLIMLQGVIIPGKLDHRVIIALIFLEIPHPKIHIL